MVNFLIDKLVKYGIEILVKIILKWVEEQQKKETVALKSGWADQ